MQFNDIDVPDEIGAEILAEADRRLISPAKVIAERTMESYRTDARARDLSVEKKLLLGAAFTVFRFKLQDIQTTTKEDRRRWAYLDGSPTWEQKLDRVRVTTKDIHDDLAMTQLDLEVAVILANSFHTLAQLIQSDVDAGMTNKHELGRRLASAMEASEDPEVTAAIQSIAIAKRNSTSMHLGALIVRVAIAENRIANRVVNPDFRVTIDDITNPARAADVVALT
jgi:hypothetical protein